MKRFGDFEFVETRRRLTRGGHVVRLTGQTLDLLCLLLRCPGDVVTREEIKNALWPASKQNLDHSLDVIVSRLRRILGDDRKDPLYIETVPRKGLRFLPGALIHDCKVETGPGRCGQQPPLANFRQVARASLGKLAPFAGVALLAAAAAILIAHTRYQRFVPAPPARPPVSSRR